MMLNWSYIPPLKEWKNMKRILASVLVLSVMSVGLVGCGDKTTKKTETKTSTPTGSEKTTTTTETTKTGDKK